MVANPNQPVKDLCEFIALACAKPGVYTFASSGNGSVNHLLGEMLQMESGVKILHVPYRGVAQAVTDTLGGQVDTAFNTVPPVL
jgi:tripartite-type tricarboxylate transporter receptor subunit TctC